MRGVYAFVGAMAIFALGAGLVINRSAVAEPPGHVTITEYQQANGQQPALEPVPELAPDDYAYATEQGRGCRCRQGCYSRMLGKWAEDGYFNCRCRGSYKFPVLPQYTYHWPGMYSQQTMTEYNSPYRFPALKDPPVDEAEPKPDQEVGPPGQQDRFEIRQAGRLEFTQPEMPPSHLPTAEPVSRKIKRHYGLN